MAAKLVAEEGVLKGLVLTLEDGDQWVIGRDPDACQLLVEDPSASRKHMICRVTPNGIVAENLSETNPVQVNEEELKEPRLLHNGDAVKIGDGTFRFYSETEAHLDKDNHKEDHNDDEIAPSASEPKTDVESTMDNELTDHETNSSLNENQTSEHTSETKPQESESEPQEELPQEQNDQEMKEPSMEPRTSNDAPNENTSAIENFDHETVAQEDLSEDGEKRHDSIFEEEASDKHQLAEINFGILDTGRWLLKVISGPNNGAEFSMQSGSSYIIGTDPNACDIVFHDTSVSRQHTRITVNSDDTLVIDDLKSRNGTIIEGEKLQGKLTLSPNTLISVGTTSFVVFDREGEMQTIISPLMPSIVKVLQQEEPKKEEVAPVSAAVTPVEEPVKPSEPKGHGNFGSLLLIGALTGLFLLGAIGTSTLFRSEPVVVTQPVDTSKVLSAALDTFPNVKYSFTPSTGQLLLVGHVLTSGDKNQLLYSLQGLKFIKNLDDNGVIIDEFVWREINQVLEKNPEWKGINVMATTPGHFAVTGYLQSRSQADRLSEYLSANFPYPNLLENRTVIEQELQSNISTLLQGKGLKSVLPKLNNGEVTLTGSVPPENLAAIDAIISEIKEIRGVRSVRNATVGALAEQSLVNISDKYEVTGSSNVGGKLSVVVNGRILMKGDVLDGMLITTIQPNVIYLEKEGTKYRIDINH